MLYCLAFTKEAYTKISECLGVNLRTVQRIRKELDESIDDDKGTVSRKPDCNRPDQKITEFVSKIHAMIDNDPSKSIMSITRHMSFLSGR